MTLEREITAIGFSNVDEQPAAGALVNYLDVAAGIEVIQQWKNLSYALLEPRDGASLLDVGCGTGDDVRALATMVGTSGRVVGTDVSEAMIAEARARSAGTNLPVEFRTCDAHELDLPDASFDGVKVERVLQHVEKPRRVLEEMIRVARPGARIVAIEPDWDTLVVDAPDRSLSRRILTFRSDNASHTGPIGRQLAPLFTECGLAEVQAQGVNLILRNFVEANAVFALELWAGRAVEAGVVTEPEADAWSRSLGDADAAGRFFAAVTGFLVVGRKP